MKKVLVIRYSSIGDIILTSPVIRCLRQQQPTWQIHVLTKKSYALLYQSNPYIDKVFCLTKENSSTILQELKTEHYDHIIDLQRSIRSIWLRCHLRRPGRSFPKLNLRKYLLVRLGVNLMPDIHIVDRYFKACKRLNIVNDGKGLDFFIDPDTPSPKALLPLGYESGYIVFANGGRHQTKIIPVAKAVEICKKIEHKVILLGGSEDTSRGDEIAQQSGKHVFNACGRLSLMQSARVMQSSIGVITGDTGLMHIAAALGLPMVTVWGNTVPSFGMYPYMPEAKGQFMMAEVPSLACRPCSKLGYPSCPEKHFRCMMDQDSSKIVSTLRGLIAE